MATYSFDGKFTGNILVVGRTGGGKTTFIQKLGTNKLLGSEITDVFFGIKNCFIERKRRLYKRQFH